jgi:hypothetical protein
LCKELGYAHPDLLLNELTARQVIEWEAYDRLEPIGEWRADFRMAYICSVVTNIAISALGKKGTKLSSPKEFLLEWDKDSEKGREVKKQSIAEMKIIMEGIARSFERKNKNKNKTIPRNFRNKKKGK